MLSYKEYINEALITFGGKAYPKFGQVVILQGGGGSGKGFIKDKLLGIEGWVYDVDRLKTLAINSKLFANKVKEETGVDLKKMDLFLISHSIFQTIIHYIPFILAISILLDLLYMYLAKKNNLELNFYYFDIQKNIDLLQDL